MSKSRYVLIPILLLIAAIAAGAFLPRRTSVEFTVATSSGGVVPPAASSSTTITPPKPETETMTGTVNGIVQLGPTCPVEHIPPQPQCADKPYQTRIHIYEGDSSVLYRTISSSAQGAFSIQLVAGSYTFAPVGAEGMPPTCRPSKISVVAGQSQEIQLDCDTGIR